MNTFKKFLPIIILLGLSYWAIAPFFHSGFFPIHDDAQVQRVFEMKKALADGMFPVRWVADLGYGYGYPIFNFYAPFAYYVGGLIALIGFNALIATKAAMVLAVISAGVSMYLFAREFWGEAGGLVSGLLYLYAPYHAIDIYVRGDFAEFFAYAFLPLVFLSIWKIYSVLKQKSSQFTVHSSRINPPAGRKLSVDAKALAGKQLKNQKLLWIWFIIGSFSYALIIISHNLTAMMITPFLFAWCVLFYLIPRFSGEKKSYFVLLTLLFGIGLATFYWLPTLMELKYTNVLSQVGGGADYHDHFVCLSQLWNSPWGFGGSTRGCLYDGLSFKIGKIHILLSLLSILTCVLLWKKEKTKAVAILFSLISLAFSVFLMLQQSQFIWDTIPQMAFLQYPWRFLLVTALFTAFVSGACILLLEKLFKRLRIPYRTLVITGFVTIGIVVILFVTVKVFNPQVFWVKTTNEYTSNYSLTWITSQISDEYMPKGFLKPRSFAQVPKTKIATQNTSVAVLSFSEKTQSINAEVSSKKQTDLLINQAYFPGWHVYLDGQQAWFKYLNKGLLVTIPKGRHSVSIRFSQTPIELIADTISFASFLFLILGIIWMRKPVYETKKT